MGLISSLPNSQRLLTNRRQFEKWKIPRAFTANICPTSDSICRSHGKLDCSIHSQRFRKGALGNQRVSASSNLGPILDEKKLQGIASQTGKNNLALREGRTDISGTL